MAAYSCLPWFCLALATTVVSSPFVFLYTILKYHPRAVIVSVIFGGVIIALSQQGGPDRSIAPRAASKEEWAQATYFATAAPGSLIRDYIFHEGPVFKPTPAPKPGPSTRGETLYVGQ
jgi:hypothetical protein